MTKLRIREPIWKTNSIGVATFRAIQDLEITIAYKDKSGKQVFPGKYYIRKEKLHTYPIQYCGKIKLYIIPIEDLIIKSERKIDRQKKEEDR